MFAMLTRTFYAVNLKIFEMGHLFVIVLNSALDRRLNRYWHDLAWKLEKVAKAEEKIHHELLKML